MDCIGILILLAPVIIFIIHVIAALARSNQGPPAVARGKPAPPPLRPNRPGAQPRPLTDLERFLQEVQQRREVEKPKPEEEPTSNAERSQSVPVPPPVRSRTVELPQEASVEMPRPRQRPGTAKQARRKRPEKKQEVDLKPAPATNEGPVVRTIAPVVELPKVAVDPSSPVAQLVEMLRTPRSIAAGIMLSEVLGPPLCKRQKRT